MLFSFARQWLLVLGLSSAQASLSPLEEASLPVGNVVVGGLDSASPISMPPDCWVSALEVFDLHVSAHIDACGKLTTDQQKLLAIEISLCHLDDIGRSLFALGDDEMAFHICSDLGYRENLAFCLKYLSPSGETSYTHFVTSISQLCTRVQHELIIAQYNEASFTLKESASKASGLFEDLQEQFGSAWEAQADNVMEIQALYKNLMEEMANDRSHRQEDNMRYWAELRDNQEQWMEHRDELEKKRQEEIALYYTELSHQREELGRLSDVMERARLSIKPWSIGVTSMVSAAKKSIGNFLKGLYAFGNCLIVWILTMPRSLRYIRPYVFGWIVFIIGVDAVFGLRCGDDEGCDLQLFLSTLLAGELVIFFDGVILASCLCPSRRANPESFESETMNNNASSSANKVDDEITSSEQRSNVEHMPAFATQPSSNSSTSNLYYPQQYSVYSPASQFFPPPIMAAQPPLAFHQMSHNFDPCHAVSAGQSCPQYQPPLRNFYLPPVFHPPSAVIVADTMPPIGLDDGSRGNETSSGYSGYSVSSEELSIRQTHVEENQTRKRVREASMEISALDGSASKRLCEAAASSVQGVEPSQLGSRNKMEAMSVEEFCTDANETK